MGEQAGADAADQDMPAEVGRMTTVGPAWAAAGRQDLIAGRAVSWRY